MATFVANGKLFPKDSDLRVSSSLKPQEYMDDSEWGITNTLSASSSSTAKTVRISCSFQFLTIIKAHEDKNVAFETVGHAEVE